jgi:hypothetical protein
MGIWRSRLSCEIVALPDIPKREDNVPQFEYRTEVLTSMVGRDKLRVNDLDDALKKHAADGWELVSLNLDADLKEFETVTCWCSSVRAAELARPKYARTRAGQLSRLATPEALVE